MARVKRTREAEASPSQAEGEVTVAEAGIPMGEPWKPVIIERMRDVEEYNRTKYFSLDHRIANIPSSIKAPFFDLLQTEFYIPDGYEIRKPEDQERVYWQPEGGWIPIHRQLLLFGVRFPLRPFVLELLHTVGLSLNQLAPNSFIHLNSFIALCATEEITPTIDFFYQFFSLTACKEKGFFQIIKNAGRETLMDTPSSNKGWHGDWFFIKGPDTELVGPWSNPNKDQLNPNRITPRRLEEFEALYARRPPVKWNRLLLNDQDWLHAHGLADCGKNPDNEAILEAAGIPRTKLTGAEKVRMARKNKAAGATKPNKPSNIAEEASGSAPPEKAVEVEGTAVIAEAARADKLGNKRRKITRQASAEGREDPSQMTEHVATGVGASGNAEDQEKEAFVRTLREDEPSPPEEEPLLRRSQRRPSPPPSTVEHPRAEAAGTSAEGLGSSIIPCETTGAESGDLKTLMEMLFSVHAKGNGLLLQVSDQVKTLERDLKKAVEENTETKEKFSKVRAQLRAQHDSFHIMKNDYEAMRKEKAKTEKEMAALRDQAQNADKQAELAVGRAEEAVRQTKEAVQGAEEARARNTELEGLLQKQKEQIDQSSQTIQVQTDQMRNLKENIQMIVEGWSSKEADWLEGPIAPASPSLLSGDLRGKVIEQYKASNTFLEDIQDAVVNEFNDGFEYARELVREKGHDPDALGIIIPEE